MITNIKFRFYAFLLITGASLILSGCVSKKQKKAAPVSHYDQLKSMFLDPPAEYRSTPLWDWNDRITEEGIDFQLQKFKEGGLGGVFVHPRPGLLTEYISEDWYHLFDHTVKKGKELGLKVWIYDENSYPSGFAGGHVPAGMPDSYIHGTGMSCEARETWIADTVHYDVVLKQEAKGFRDITAETENETGNKGVYYLFKKTYGQKSYWYGNYPYVDLLYKGVTQKFIDVTMQGYEKNNRQDFGKTLMGTFSDEPNLEAAMGPNSAFRWTPDLFEEFSKRWHYDLKLNMPSLVDEVGDWKKVRHDYYEVILAMFIDRWAKPWNKYCSEKGLLWTGHYWEHGWPVPTEGIDEASFYIYHQQPGIDMLGNEMIPGGNGGQFGNTRAVRELRSAANQSGSVRTLSETYGGAGWEINFTNFKRLVDWEVVLGVNFVNQHLSYYTLKGVRKFDYPPSFSYHEPWWKNYKYMGDYIGRISLAMSSGNQVNRILVLQPNTTAWMFFSRKVNNNMVDSVEKSFKKFVYRLERNLIEYDLGSENVLRTLGSVRKGLLTVGERSYEWVVIPESMQNVDGSTLNLLRKFLDQGGRIMSFTGTVPFVDGVSSLEVSKLIQAYPKQWKMVTGTNDPVVKEAFKQDDFSISEPNAASGELYFQRRIMEDGQLLFLVNSDTLSNARATLSAKGKSLVRMDPATGKCYSVAAAAEKGMILFNIELPPAGSAIYYVSENILNEPADITPGLKEEAVSPQGEVSVKAEAENVLVLNYLDLKTSGIDQKDIYFMKAMHMLYDSNGFSMGNPWQHKIQYKQDYLALDTFGTGSGFEVSYHFSINKNTDLQALGNISAVVERPELWDVYLNGSRISKSDQWWIDRDFYRFPLDKKLVTGKNTITLKASKMSVFAELMPIYIIGDFLVNPMTVGFEMKNGSMSKTGTWKDNGYPFYAQEVSYSQKYKLKAGTDYAIKLKKWNGTLAEVIVNGISNGLILWPPYELNIGSGLKEGENEITVKITGSLKNTFGYFYKNNKQWINGPGDWDEAPAGTPSFNRYYLMDYGLMEPFGLVRRF